MKKGVRFLSICCALVLVSAIVPSIPSQAACEHQSGDVYEVIKKPSCYQSGTGRYYCLEYGITLSTETTPYKQSLSRYRIHYR